MVLATPHSELIRVEPPTMWTSEAIEDLYQRHSYSVFRRCRSLLRDEAEAHDIAHEVFVQLLERREGFRGAASASTYLYAIATHLCLTRIRNKAARGEGWQGQVSREVESTGQLCADRTLDARQLWSAILNEADAVTAQIAVYHFVDGLAQGEVAELVGLSRMTVNQRLGKFRDQARQLVGGSES
jgi:RNA polymerase sigma-70 factor (ECF subfamily)